MSLPLLSVTLLHLQRVISRQQLEHLRLFAEIVGVPRAKTEKASLQKLHYQLRESTKLCSMATPLLQAMLEVIQVDSQTVSRLDSSKERLEECTALSSFKLGCLVSYIILNLREDEFHKLKELVCSGALKIQHNPDGIESSVELFRVVCTERLVCEDNVQSLREWMEELRLMKCVSRIDEYRRGCGDIAAVSQDRG